jgi:predicted alpha/beta-hydrolase family hydrolase
MSAASHRRLGRVRRWIRIGFFAWATFATAWMANSFRTRGVDAALLQSSATIAVESDNEQLAFVPRASVKHAGLVFICGSGVTAEAYAPLLRPLADQGYRVVIVRLPYRFALLDGHRQEAIERALRHMGTEGGARRWVIAGHSLGGALAARLTHAHADRVSALVLLGTTHPRDHDLSSVRLPVTKVVAENDGVAPMDRVLANKAKLPLHTKWVEIPGGNHSYFGRYGHQLFDGTATISRDEQESIARAALLAALEAADAPTLAEAQLIRLVYAFEQATRHRRTPRSLPTVGLRVTTAAQGGSAGAGPYGKMSQVPVAAR